VEVQNMLGGKSVDDVLKDAHKAAESQIKIKKGNAQWALPFFNLKQNDINIEITLR
jgi:hypothetical protein